MLTLCIVCLDYVTVISQYLVTYYPPTVHGVLL